MVDERFDRKKVEECGNVSTSTVADEEDVIARDTGTITLDVLIQPKKRAEHIDDMVGMSHSRRESVVDNSDHRVGFSGDLRGQLCVCVEIVPFVSLCPHAAVDKHRQ